MNLAMAQSQPPQRTVWDGVYNEAQASRGLTAFGQNCSRCHDMQAEGKAPLVGDAFWKSFSQTSVHDLLDFVSKNMPNGAPGSLTEAAYQDIVAYMLKSNGFPAGAADLAAANLAEVQIVPRDGNTKLPANALVRVVGCLTRSGSDWTVTKATNPERIERAGTSLDDGTRALAGRTFQLKYLVTKLDSMLNSRVTVSGLLIGADGKDGINVTTVNRVAPTCP